MPTLSPTASRSTARRVRHLLSEELAVAAQGGDVDAAGELYRRIWRRARRAAASFCGVTDADDAVVEGLARALDRIGQLRDPATVEAWLVRCAVRAAIDLSRQRARHPMLDLSTLADECWRVSSESADRTVLVALDQRAMTAAVGALPAHQRSLLQLRYHLGWSVDAIASVTGRPPGTIRRQCLEARRCAAEQFLSRQLTPAAGACALVTRSLCREPYRRPAKRDRLKAAEHLMGCSRCRVRQREVQLLLAELGGGTRPRAKRADRLSG